MYTACYILAGVIAVWGGCLVARVIANRLEHGLFRRRSHKVGVASNDAAWTAPVKRSWWWTWVGIAALAGGTWAAIETSIGERELSTGRPALSGAQAKVWVGLTFMSLGLGGGLAIVGLRFDPSRGRRRCPRCWYDLSATPGRLCPECGHEPASERRLFGTRRSRPTIALALVVLLAAPVGVRVREFAKNGWIGAVPTTVLIPLWRLSPRVFGRSTAPTSIGQAASAGGLADRLARGDLWEWQRAWLESSAKSVLGSARDPRELLEAVQVWEETETPDTPEGATLLPRSMADSALELMEYLHDKDPSVSSAAADLLPAVAQAITQHPDSASAREARAKLLDLACEDRTKIGTIASQNLGWFHYAPEELDRIAAAARSKLLPRGSGPWLLQTLLRADGSKPGRVYELLTDPDENVRAASLVQVGRLVGGGELRATVARAIEVDTPTAAGAAALGLSQLWDQSTRERDVILARARRDAASAGAMAPALDTLLSRGRLVGADMESVLPALLDALESRVPTEADAALSCVARLDDRVLVAHERTRPALTRLVDDATRPASQRDSARAILKRLAFDRK